MNCKNLPLLVLILLLLGIEACVSPKKVVYFNNLNDTIHAGLSTAKTIFDSRIQKNDLLSISIGGSNAADLVALNSGSGIVPGAIPGSSSKSFGYLVDPDGKIQLPFIGRITAEGLTRLQLEDTITTLMEEYTKNPVVNVKFLNYNFSILGEVNHPGKFDMEERTTVLQAISLAGDLTTLAKRNNILVIREVNGKREFGRLNLLSKDAFKSPYFYLKTNDVVYVEPVRSKFLSRTGAPQYIGLAAAGITLLLTLLNFSKK